ncbi:hypothetical protein LX13_003170 [Williamsia maris]|uniref:Uncharacterized protein n=1 Tax=Williamsia maris TaxID=72806 RepID=A0ABT1HGG3_9NOCA|nr:hypothetical protein [Williamsia maris]
MVIVLIGALAMTLSTGGSRPSTTAESTFQKAPGVGDCVEFSTLPSGTETTTVRSCSAVEATLQVTQTFPPADGETTGTCPKSEFSITSPTYTRGAARRSTGDFITCYQPNFREGQCYLLDAGQEQESSFANLRSVSCATGSLRVIRRVDGDATDAACRGLQGKYTIQNFTRPARTFCYAENK